MQVLLLDPRCSADDTIGDLKKLIAAQTGTKWDRIVLKKWYVQLLSVLSNEHQAVNNNIIMVWF